MLVRELLEVYLNPRDVNWGNTSAARMQAAIARRIGGKARLGYLPQNDVYTEGAPWFIFALAPEKFIPKIMRSLEDLAREFQVSMVFNSDPETIDQTPNGRRLYQLAANQMGYAEMKAKHPNIVLLVAYVASVEQEASSNQLFYHVTFDPSTLRTGLKPSSTLKYKGRIYLWNNLANARYFAGVSHHGGKPAYILQVKPVGTVYVDQEYRYDPQASPSMKNGAFYSKEPIPASNIKPVE